MCAGTTQLVMTSPGGEMLKQEGDKQAEFDAPTLEAENMEDEQPDSAADMDQSLLTPAPPALQEQEQEDVCIMSEYGSLQFTHTL